MNPTAPPFRPALPSADALIGVLDRSLRTLSGAAHAGRPLPGGDVVADDAAPLGDDARRLSGALMRVNHVGEVCAQALYQAQALTARTPALRQQMEQAAREETDHLAWTEQRLADLGARPSLLNPLWYAGAFGLGLAAGALGDRVSLGFVVETERQVEAHLGEHLDRLPAEDAASRAIVAQMKADEAAHGAAAHAAGGMDLPAPVHQAMKLAAGVMTRTAHHL